MLVDVHTHCIQPEHVGAASKRANERAGYPPMQPLLFEEFSKEMEIVDKAIVFGVRAIASGQLSPNDYTAEWVRRDPSKFIGFAAIDPTEEDHLEEMERSATDLGLRGFKIYPMLARFNPADPTVFPNVRNGPKTWLADPIPHWGTPLTSSNSQIQPSYAVRRSMPGIPGLEDRACSYVSPVAARLRHRPAKASKPLCRRIRSRMGPPMASLGGIDTHARVGCRR